MTIKTDPTHQSQPAEQARQDASERLENNIEFLEDCRWALTELERTGFKQYQNNYVAILNKTVIDSGDNDEELRATAAKKHNVSPERIIIEYIADRLPTTSTTKQLPLIISEIFKELRIQKEENTRRQETINALSYRLYSRREIWTDTCDKAQIERAHKEADDYGVPVSINVHGTHTYLAHPSELEDLRIQISAYQRATRDLEEIRGLLKIAEKQSEELHKIIDQLKDDNAKLHDVVLGTICDPTSTALSQHAMASLQAVRDLGKSIKKSQYVLIANDELQEAITTIKSTQTNLTTLRNEIDTITSERDAARDVNNTLAIANTRLLEELSQLKNHIL